MLHRSSALFFAAVSAALAGDPVCRLDVEVLPRFYGAPLVFDSVSLTTAQKQTVSVTRCDFLLSELALQREDGSWTGPPGWAEYLSLREGRTAFSLGSVPAANYKALRFHVGVPAATNATDPAKWPAGHPLNPSVNGLHWGWQGGYIFLALEGLWKKGAGETAGWSFHVANDPQLMTVELPLALDLTRDQSLRLGFDVASVFSGRHPVTLSAETSTTHSRKGDPLAVELKENAGQAFRIESLTAAAAPANRAGARRVALAPGATPFRFTFSAVFPRPALPLDNPLTDQGVALGEKLFESPLLSINNTQSCAACHQTGSGFTDNHKVSVGAEGGLGTRNSMPIFNLAWKSAFFWDGRAPTLREQAVEPIQNPVEMHETLPRVVEKLAAASEWPPLFKAAFGTPEITADRMALALEQFLLTRISSSSRFDRAFRGEVALTDEEKHGFELFHTEYDPRHEQFGADCFHCHGGALFASLPFANNGLDATFADPGRSKVTGREGDLGKFAVPSLRNVALTAPYMHDGRFATLEEVIDHYSTGVKRSATLDPNLAKHPEGGLHLSEADKKALVAFLKSLTES